MKSLSVTIEMKATEQYLPEVLFIKCTGVVQSFESVDEILKCDHSNEPFGAPFLFGALFYAFHGS